MEADEEYFPQENEQQEHQYQHQDNIKTYNIGNLKGSQSLTSLPTESSFLRYSNSLKKRRSDTETIESITQQYKQKKKENQEKQHKQKQEQRPPIVQLKSSKSTPLQKTPSGRQTGRKRLSSSGSIKLAKTLNKIPIVGNPNRAHVVIRRYENWLVFLKCMIGWLDETSKISMTTSRAFSSRAAPHLKSASSIQTIQSGLKVLTKHVSEKQHEFSKQLEKHVHTLTDLRKLCKEKMHKLKNDPQLMMDELLRRAEVTRGKMTHLNRCCKQADKSKSQELEMDPWLANLYVLRQLKKEVDEENRLRLLMVIVQQEMKAFEKQLITVVKTAVEYSYTNMAPTVWDGSNDPETASFQQILDQVMPDHEWSVFYEQNINELVNEDQPTKDYLKFNYPNKLHPAVMTLRKGKMERKFGGVRKQFVQRYFILSQGGYLHQFRLNDKVSPERTLYIPGSSVHPSVDIHAGQIESLYGTPPADGYTFDMFKPGSGSRLLQNRDKSTSFRTETRDDLVAWCRLITMVSSGLDPSVVYEISSFPSFSSSIEESTTSLPGRRPSKSSSIQPDIPEETEVSASPIRSHISKNTIESFNEPFYMSKEDGEARYVEEIKHVDKKRQVESFEQPQQQEELKKEDDQVIIEEKKEEKEEENTTEPFSNSVEDIGKQVEQKENLVEITKVTPPITPPEATVMHETITEEDEPPTDAESFVTASRHDSDNESINSVATARGLPGKSPSLVSTTFDDAISHISTNYDDARSISSYYTDAQSSAYFSSHSANNSNRSSVASMPDLPWDLNNERMQTYQP
ncbi:hypothetical protein K501DRAFT_256354, partial [Backusella circina FSU 941]